MPKIATAKIGKAGELFVQYQLLLLGVESAPMTTDTGIDLVAYSPIEAHPHTIQIKTMLAPTRAGGKGKWAIDWWIRENSPAEYVALVELSSQNVWMLTHQELLETAQQRSNGKCHIYMHLENVRTNGKHARTHINHFEGFLLPRRLNMLFGLENEMSAITRPFPIVKAESQGATDGING